MTTSKNYQINEKDIEGVINYLKVTDPDNANPETAIELLEYLQATFHNMAHDDLNKLNEIYLEFKRQKKMKLN